MINEELHALYEKKIAELQADLAASRNTINEIMPHPCRMREDGTCELGECEPCVPRLQYRLAAARAEIAGMAVELSAARAELEAEETASGKLLAECEWYRRELVESRAENAWRVTVEQVKAWLESWNLDENPSMEVTDAECGILASLASAKEPT